MKRILHISDLHITKANFADSNVVTTYFDEDANFADKFINSVNKNCQDKSLDNIIISGDLANMSDAIEYDATYSFLEKLCSSFHLEKKDILIIPGNHDINWGLCEGYYNVAKGNALIEEKEFSKMPYEFNEKYKNFKTFYDKFQDGINTFDPNKKIVWYKAFDDIKLVLMGLNTNEHECHLKEYHYGYISHASLKAELDILKEKYNQHKFVVFSHHIITSTNEINQTIKNQLEIFNLLNTTHEISTFFCGHQHVGGGRKTQEEYANEFFSFGVGSLAKIGLKVQNSYCLLDFDILGSTYELKKAEIDFRVKGPQNQWSSPEINMYEIYKENKIEAIPNTVSKSILSAKSNSKAKRSQKIITVSVSPRLNEYSKKIVGIVKENGFLKSGHFHWSPNSRTLGAINTSAMFSKFEYLSLAKSSIIDLIHEKQLSPEIVVGLGMEGNLLSANISSIIGCKTSYSPYIIRKDHHVKQEIQLDFIGVKKLALITDVAHKGHTVRDLLLDKKEIFKDVEEIYLISIFYTSKTADYDPSLFEKFDKRIKFYTVCQEIKIEDCSFCDEVEDNCRIENQEYKCKTCEKSFNNCIVYRENLETVFKFY